MEDMLFVKVTPCCKAYNSCWIKVSHITGIYDKGDYRNIMFREYAEDLEVKDTVKELFDKIAHYTIYGEKESKDPV